MGRVHSARASVGRGTCGACKLSTRLPQSEFPSEGNQFELGLYEEPRTPLWLSQRQTLERLRHGDPGCGDDRRHEDFDFADADEVDAIAAKMTSLSVGDSSLTSWERTWPRRRSPWRSPATRLTEWRFRDVERSPRQSPSPRQRRQLLHGDRQHHPARCR